MKIIFTRQKKQAQELATKLQSLGLAVYFFPTFYVKPLYPSPFLLKDSDILIFVSPNAVTYGFPLLINNATKEITFIAVGLSTAQSLHQQGIRHVICPEKEYNTTGLLALPILQSNFIKNKKIVLIHGENSRDILPKTLRQRGAHVECVNCYQTILPTLKSTQSTREIWQKEGMDVILCTSVQALENLHYLLGNQAFLWQTTPLIVSSERIVQHALTLGHQSIIYQAKSALDRDLYDMITTLSMDNGQRT